jgi:uncharacterized membrane protein required for colicin V production
MKKVASLAAIAAAAYTAYFFYPELRRYMRIRSM